MSAHAFLTHRTGRMEPFTTATQLAELLAELDDDTDDAEHPDVAVSTESGWTLSAFHAGHLIWENVETDRAPRHRVGLSRTEQLRLLTLLAHGDLDEVERADWQPGYPS
jgi:hypothetical protein